VNHVARDLKWAVESPVLCLPDPPLFAEWAHAGTGGPVDAELASYRRRPIGRYFERLIVHWLKAQEGVRGLEANLPLRRGPATVGELDLLFEVDGNAYHWELALKFYLGTGDRTQASQWFGPLGRDRLDYKLDKLQTQLRLLETPEGRALLAERGWSSVESHPLVKGYLFHPFAAWRQQQRRAPHEVNPEHAHGWWIHASDVKEICQRSEQWLILEKSDWLAPAHTGERMNARELEAWLRHYFEAETHPPMLAAMEEGRELERGFVVPDDWSPEPRPG
jgi:hypothetical protein